MAGEITFTGLSSNIDLNTIIDALIAARRSSHITPLENWKTDWETKLESISALDSALSSFYTTVRGMDRINELLVRTASSSNETVLTASANSDAIPGSHTVEVHQLAQAEKEVHLGIQNGIQYHSLGIQNEIQYHSGVADKTASINGSGIDKTFVYSYGGATRTITVHSGDTLENLRDDITNDLAGVTAKIVTAGGKDHLVLVETVPDASKEIILDPNEDMTLDGTDTTTDLRATTFAQTINGSSIDKTFVYSYGGATRTITVHSGDTLENLRDDITNDLAGVTAKIVTAGGKDHLVLVETTPDGSKEIILDPNGDMTLDGTDDTTDLTASTFAQTVNASGADKVFQYQYGSGSNISVTVATGATLQQLRDLINNDATNPGVRASILDDGGTGSAAMHLVLSGEDLGKDYTITLNPGAGTTLDGTSDTEDFTNGGGVFTETMSAQNAELRVDGYPPASWIERATNHVTDVIEGVTMDLGSPGNITLTVSTDTSATLEKIEAFKDAFNNVRTAIKDATLYNADTGESGSLLGNYAVQIIQSQLNNLIAGKAPGFQDPDDTYVNLQQLGFSTDVTQGSETEGLLLLDTTILTAALNSDPDAVTDVFSAYFEGLSNDSQISYQSSLPSITSAGIYDVEVDTDAAQGRFKLSTEATWHDWIALTGSSGDYTLTGAAGYAEKGLALHITYGSGTGTHSAVVRMKNGIVTQMGFDLEDLLSTSGPLNTLDGSYNDIVTNIEKRIEQEEDRLDHYEALLRQRFVRLDSYMNQMNQLGNYLTQYVAYLSK